MDTRRITRLAALAAVAYIPFLAACAERPASGDEANMATAEPPAPAAPHEVSVTARNYAFDGLPDTLQSGPTTIHLTNGGPAPEVHHVSVIHIQDGHTAAEFDAALKSGKMPDWAHELGGPSVNTIPGQISSATVDLVPGSYLVLCFIPGPDGVPHVMKGMVKAVTVVPSTGPAAAMPVADVEIVLADYNFAISKPLTAGHHVIKVTTAAGMQAHEMVLVKLEAGKKAADVVTFVETMKGPPPAAFLGGVSGMAAGVSNTFAVDLTPGEYALICFLPDTKDGKMHAHHGMTQQITVQ